MSPDVYLMYFVQIHLLYSSVLLLLDIRFLKIMLLSFRIKNTIIIIIYFLFLIIYDLIYSTDDMWKPESYVWKLALKL
jgi:hypothetical protein